MDGAGADGVPRPELRIRRATPEDAASIATTHVASWRAGYAGLMLADLLAGLSVAERTTSWTTYLGPDATGHTVLAAGEDDVVRGFATVGRSRDEDAAAGTGELWALYVHPDSWGHGVGGALHDSATQVLRDLGCARATLWVLTGNRRARRFYEAHGWRHDGEVKTDLRDGVPLDEVRYERGLA